MAFTQSSIVFDAKRDLFDDADCDYYQPTFLNSILKYLGFPMVTLACDMLWLLSIFFHFETLPSKYPSRGNRLCMDDKQGRRHMKSTTPVAKSEKEVLASLVKLRNELLMIVGLLLFVRILSGKAFRRLIQPQPVQGMYQQTVWGGRVVYRRGRMRKVVRWLGD
jgi:hypothetical protein